MAELAAGAVSSLLGVISNEALLLGSVRHDVQFIQEEMESMKSFLAHLARKAPAGGEHDEQIRTWMNQVRLLAQDSNNCIDMYLYRGNPEIHLARGGLRRYISWLPWFVHKMVAQHRAAIQLRALRERARDIGERRLRYGVEVPAKGEAEGQLPAGARLTPVAALSSSVHAAATSAASGDEEEGSDDQLVVAMAGTDHYGPRGAFFEPRTPEENVKVKLADWIKNVAQGNAAKEKSIPSIVVVAPDKEETRAVADEASAMWKKHYMRSVLVDIPAVHFYILLLKSQDILYYILWELQSSESQPQQQQGQGEEEEQQYIDRRKEAIMLEKFKLIDAIKKSIQGMKVDDKFSQIKNTIKQMKGGKLQLNMEQMNHDQLGLLQSAKDEPLGVLLLALWLLKLKPAEGTSATKEGQEKKETTRSHDDIIKETAKKLKEYMEEEEGAKSKLQEHMEEDADEKLKLKGHTEEEAGAKPIHLKEDHYEHILQEVFPMTIWKPPQIGEQDSKQATSITATSTIILVEDQIKEMIRKVLHELQENKPMIKLEITDGKPSQDHIPDALIEETIKKIEEIKRRMKEQLETRGIMDKISDCLKTRGDHMILVILKLDDDYVSEWEETRIAFSLLGCIAGALMLTIEVNRARAKEYCCPPREPIDYSLLGLYHDTVLELTNQKMNEASSQIFLDILDKSKSDEFCMKIFVHALYSNPKRSNEELSKLQRTLQQDLKNPLDNIAKKMFKFCYSDLPKEYKSCLLYLAIFPRRQSIRRSTLISRWVVEGLITKADWASSVRHANRCFEVLIDRWLVYPADFGATGQVKSCVIGNRVHGFITKIARKQRIVETRLSHHLARHFSIFNDLRLRGSDRIDKFFQKLYEESSRVSLIKVLDLEGCQCFGGTNQHYLKDICSKMLLLKYLSLRETDVTLLPSEINNLRELEVLDIRQTNVPPSATVHVLLLKLKRLLAGSFVPSSRSGGTELSSVKVPDKIGKMLNMEVLSNVKARNSQDLKDIGKLWQLRKLGVVIEHKDEHLRNLLRAISDLHECLQSLSITLPMTSKEFTTYVLGRMLHSPKILESLSITGTTQKGQLLRLLTKNGDQPKLSKVTLTRTQLKQVDLKVLAKLPKLACLRLQDKAYIDSKLTFNKEEFENLKFFLVEGSNMVDISFGDGTVVNLEKIILCSTHGLESLCGVENLPKLKEVELKNSNKLSLFDKAINISKVTLCGSILRKDEVQILAKIPNMRCLILKEKSYVQSQLMFNKDDFPRLNLLIIGFSVTNKIIFTRGSAPKLEKIVWSFTKDTVGTLYGIDNLPKLKELEFNADFVPIEVEEAIKKHKNKPELIHNKPESQGQEMGNISEKGDVVRFPLCWKSQA